MWIAKPFAAGALVCLVACGGGGGGYGGNTPPPISAPTITRLASLEGRVHRGPILKTSRSSSSLSLSVEGASSSRAWNDPAVVTDPEQPRLREGASSSGVHRHDPVQSALRPAASPPLTGRAHRGDVNGVIAQRRFKPLPHRAGEFIKGGSPATPDSSRRPRHHR